MADEKFYIDHITIPNGETGYIRDAEAQGSIIDITASITDINASIADINSSIGELPEYADPEYENSIGSWIWNLGIKSSDADDDPCIHIETRYGGHYYLLTTGNIGDGSDEFTRVAPIDVNSKIPSTYLPSMPSTGYDEDITYGISPAVLKTIINTESPTPTGTANHLTQFNSTGTLSDGPALNPSSGDTNKVLNERGTWTELSGAYELPTASSTTLGGIKVGDNLSIADGVLSSVKTVFTIDAANRNLIISYA